MLRPMTISLLAVDSFSKSPIVILKEIDGERMLPIWIGVFEAQAIASEMEGISHPRPMTHDLLKNILETLDVIVSRIEICDLQNNTYYAMIYIDHKGKEYTIDARPSDAIALSLRVGAPIFAEDEVISKSKQIDLQSEAEDKTEEGKKWQEILEKMDPDDFGNT